MIPSSVFSSHSSSYRIDYHRRMDPYHVKLDHDQDLTTPYISLHVRLAFMEGRVCNIA